MKRLLLPGLLGLCLMGIGAHAAPRSAVTATKKPGSPVKHSISGTLVSSTATSLVIKTSKGRKMTFAMDQKTSKPTQLKAGENVQVQYLIQNGSDRALKVMERSMAATAKKSPGKIN